MTNTDHIEEEEQEESDTAVISPIDDSVVVVVSPRAANDGGGCHVRFNRRKRIFWASLVGAVFAASLFLRNEMASSLLIPKDTNYIPNTITHAKKTSPSPPDTPNPPGRGPGGSDRMTSADSSKAQPSLPVSRDDKIPAAASPGIPLHAAEALQCRESVVNFVINATDGKDECEGLKKAFDKTCSSDETSSTGSTRRRRRTLWEKTAKTRNWQVWVYQASRSLHRLAHYLWSQPPPFFFAEDQVAESWNESKFLVQQNLDTLIHDDLRRRWLLERWNSERDLGRHLEEAATTTTTTTTNKTKPVNLDLPTANKHLSEKVVSETYILHQGDKMLEKATNQTNLAAEDAAASSKALSDTTAAISSILNDPTSVEARTCCASILNVYHENCSTDEEEQVSDRRLFFVVFVMALCGMVKSIIRYYKLFWLPEAAGCILVGVLSGYILMFFPHHDISFDGNWFLRIMVPPIVFEAAISIDKRSFHRHVVPILIYAIVGTLFATVLTAEVLHRGSMMLKGLCPPIPYVEALTFGALISSIDPIAVLSVLSNMGMTDTDTIYVVIFGESLLNDGVAIVLFQTLVHFLDENLVIDSEAITAGSVHFLVVAIGSFLVGVASGMLSTVYYYLFQGCQTPLVEVLMFSCWALLPYYICDGIGWSGIVSAVAAGFVMDLYIIGQKSEEMAVDSEHTTSSRNGQRRTEQRIEQRLGRVFSPSGNLSDVARTHIHFVTEMISTMMETAIFAYLGLFLFSHRYHWNLWHTIVSILACCISRGVMIPTLSLIANWITRIRQVRDACRAQTNRKATPATPAGVVIDRKMQLVLWFAGLRGAMSFALVEHIPLYDSVSGEGTRLKPELKAMTSACIMFTVFVLGGYTYYMMDYLGMTPSSTNPKRPQQPAFEMTSLLNKSPAQSEEKISNGELEDEWDTSRSNGHGRIAFRRQRLAAS